MNIHIFQQVFFSFILQKASFVFMYIYTVNGKTQSQGIQFEQWYDNIQTRFVITFKLITFDLGSAGSVVQKDFKPILQNTTELLYYILY